MEQITKLLGLTTSSRCAGLRRPKADRVPRSLCHAITICIE